MMFQRLLPYFLLGLVATFLPFHAAAEINQDAVDDFFPDADRTEAMPDEPPATGVYRDGELIGLVLRPSTTPPFPPTPANP